MHAQARTGKAASWLLAMGGLLMAAVGPWGASSLWQTWKATLPNPQQSSRDPSSGGNLPDAPWPKDSTNPVSQGEYASSNDHSLEGLATSGLSQSGLPPFGDPIAPTLEGKAHPGPQPLSLDEVFRFDLTIREVLARWPRVSSSLADLQLQGYRVPLVTGPAETDLAGALTYYFNSYQQLQRITFQGTTGDGRELVQFLAGRYGFQRRLTNDPSLFVYEVPRLGGPPQSVLRLKLAPTLKAERPHQRFDVWLVIERPEEPANLFWKPGPKR